MKAVVKSKPVVGLEVKDMPVPKIKPNEVLVQIKVCGVCATDLGLYEWREAERHRRGKPILLPVIMGHEPAGVVVEVGSEVRNIRVGDRVTSDCRASCGFCYWCREGHFNMCGDAQVIGVQTNGAMAEYCAFPFPALYKVPDSLSFEEAAMLEPFSSAVRGFETLVHFKPGDDVVIFGPGARGLFAALLLRAAGAARIFLTGLSVDGKGLELARQLGFTTINAEKQSVREVILDATDGLGVDVVWVATSTYFPAEAIKVLKRTGQLMIVPVMEASAALEGSDLVRGEIMISRQGGSNPSTWRRAINLLAYGRVDLKPLISHRFGIEEADKAFQILRRHEGMTVLIVP